MNNAWISLDHAGLSLANALRHPGIDTAMAGITWLGSLAVLLPFAALWVWRQPNGAGRLRQGFVLLALMANTGVAHALKITVDRARPDLFPALSALPADASFPSAHTMQITGVVLALLLSAPPRIQQTLGYWFLGLGVIGVVGYSRIHLQVHFPTDVLAGLGLATLITVGLHRQLRTPA